MNFLIDLDGTLLLNNTANIDAIAFIEKVQKNNIAFMIMTNSVSSPEAIKNRLKNVGINVPITSILNPIVSINSYIKKQDIKNAFIVGSDNEVVQVCVEHEEDSPEIVVLLDFEKANANYQELQKIYLHIQNNVPVVTASGSPFYLKENNKKIDTGSFSYMFEMLSGTKIPVFGKPSENYFKEGISLLKSDPSNTIVIGDDWRTDIAGANSVGCSSVLVKSGKYSAGDDKKGNQDLVVSHLMDVFKSPKFKI